jgi:hypothetical protein
MITYFNENPVFDPFIVECLNALFEGSDPVADIEITWVDNIEDNYAGLCTGDTKEVEISLAKNYKLECGESIPFCNQELASNLAHELIHSRQFIRGEINADDYYYKGKDYESVEYAETPWEIEAYMLEQVLVDIFWSNEI